MRASKASFVILPEGVAEAKTVGTSSKPWFAQPSMRPPTGVLVPPKWSKTSSPRSRSLLSNCSMSVLIVDRTFVSWDIVPVTMRMEHSRLEIDHHRENVTGNPAGKRRDAGVSSLT